MTKAALRRPGIWVPFPGDGELSHPHMSLMLALRVGLSSHPRRRLDGGKQVHGLQAPLLLRQFRHQYGDSLNNQLPLGPDIGGRRGGWARGSVGGVVGCAETCACAARHAAHSDVELDTAAATGPGSTAYWCSKKENGGE
ncbi:hypothetical protein D3C71_793780 [compost metagenome]